jgi:antitoxin ParD1/3/4
MTRQSITLTEQNDQWLRLHVEETGEYSSKSELINDLIRRARRIEAINQKLILAEKSGFTSQTQAEILAEFKAQLKTPELP